METPDIIVPTPWDKNAFGIDTYEITTISDQALALALSRPGHYSVRIDPLRSKELLHKYGFYYCDTLIEPYCHASRFRQHVDRSVSVCRSVPIEDLLGISHGAFAHGRFHRDFNMQKDLADTRYDNWVVQLHEAGNIFGLMYENDPAAFFGITGNKVVLHAVSEKYRGRGLGKYLWSAGLTELFDSGHSEVCSSVSASNSAVVNLYSSLGFKFRNPVDVYHCFRAPS